MAVLQVEKGMNNYKANTVDVYITLLFTGEDDVFTAEDLVTLETFIARRMNITTQKTELGSQITITGTVNKPQVDVDGWPVDWPMIYNPWEDLTMAQILDEIQKWLIWKQG